MKKEQFIIDTNILDNSAKTFFLKACGFKLDDEKSIHMYKRAENVLEEIKHNLKIKYIIKRYSSDILSEDKLILTPLKRGIATPAIKNSLNGPAILGDITIKCSAFNKIRKDDVIGIYFYAITAGNVTTSSTNALDMLYSHTFGVSYLDAARAYVRDRLIKESKPHILTDSISPGFYGMDILETGKILQIVEGDSIGLSFTDNGYMKPQKSCVGIYFVLKENAIEAQNKSCGINHNHPIFKGDSTTSMEALNCQYGNVSLSKCEGCTANSGCEFCNYIKPPVASLRHPLKKGNYSTKNKEIFNVQCNNSMASIVIMPMNKTITAIIGSNLMDTLKENNIFMPTYCGGMGTCGKCVVYIKNPLGDINALSCKTQIMGDMTLFIPNKTINYGIRPLATIKLYAALNPLKAEITAPSVRNDLTGALIYQNNKFKKGYGVAVDIGTTTVAAMLWDFSTGENIYAAGALNPQSSYGSDVISRINFGSTEEGLKILQSAILGCIDSLLDELCKKAGIAKSEICYIVLVGNSTMYHITLGLCPKTLAISPFKPLQYNSVTLVGNDLFYGINNKTVAYMMPIIAGHVGSDTVAVMVALGLRQNNENIIIVDIGTNGEIVLAKGTDYITCSTAAGPAFEGASIKHGMRGDTGAIYHATISEDVHLQIVDSDVGEGICGSGLVDAVAELLSMGIITKDGVMLACHQALKAGVPPKIARRLRQTDGENEFVLYYGENKDITLTQGDIRELQLAKGGILAGIHILMSEMGLHYGDIDKIYLAGAFGNYINVTNAFKIGLIPHIENAEAIQMGNLAVVGASMVLLNDDKKEEGELYAKNTKHIELASHTDFADEFLACLPLKMPISLNFNRNTAFTD